MKGFCSSCQNYKELVNTIFNEKMCRDCLNKTKHIQRNNSPAGIG